MVGKNHSAQALTIKLLQMLSPMDRQGLFLQAQGCLAGKDAALEHLSLCVMLAGELSRCPDKYNNFENLCKTIIARQNKEKPSLNTKDFSSVTKREIGKTMGFSEVSTNNLINRIHDYARELKPQEILNLCSGFQKKSNQLFWENQIYALFPELRAPDVSDGPVLDCLQAVWDCLSVTEQNTAYYSFIPFTDWFDQLNKIKQNEAFSEDSGLYDILDEAIAHAKKRYANGIITEIYLHLEIDPDTYYSYKRKWLAFEKKGCRGPYPKNRLSRERLLYLAVFLDMSFYTTTGMLAKAGYAFHFDRMDTAVSRYLLKRGGTKEDALKYLHQTIK